jgi:PilZ domain
VPYEYGIWSGKGWQEEMGAENFGSTAVGSKRSARRARVLLAARLETKDGEIEARLRDLSQKGALVECLQVPPVGSELVFVRGAIRIPARVAWAGKDRIGLEFHHEIDEHEVFVQLGKRQQPGPVGYRRPLFPTSLSPEDRRVAKAWGVTVGLILPESDS